MKILIAEDDPVSRRLLESYLGKWGHEVVVAKNGAEAWTLFESTEFPVVITDWMMPEVDGPELIQRIRASKRPGYVYVILLTARSKKEDVVQGMESGADDFVTKPFDRDELRVRLRAGERLVNLEHNLEAQNRALNEARSALIESARLASLGMVVANVAEQINSSIAAAASDVSELVANAEKLLASPPRETTPADEVIREQLANRVSKSLKDLQRICDSVDDLMEFALDPAEAGELDLNASITSALKILQREIENNHLRVETDLRPIPAALCRVGRINPVLLRLLINAVRTCPSGGLVRVRSMSEGDKDLLIELDKNVDGLQVTENCQPFSDSAISACQDIIREQGGSIEVLPQANGNCLVRLRLPRAL